MFMTAEIIAQTEGQKKACDEYKEILAITSAAPRVPIGNTTVIPKDWIVSRKAQQEREAAQSRNKWRLLTPSGFREFIQTGSLATREPDVYSDYYDVTHALDVRTPSDQFCNKINTEKSTYTGISVADQVHIVYESVIDAKAERETASSGQRR